MEHNCRTVRVLELILGEAVAGGDEFPGAVGAHEQCRKISARGLAGMPRRLEVLARRCEITFAGADRMDVQTVQAGRKDSGSDGLDGHCGVSAAEVDRRIGDRFAVGCLQLGGQSLGAGRLAGRGRRRRVVGGLVRAAAQNGYGRGK